MLSARNVSSVTLCPTFAASCSSRALKNDVRSGCPFLGKPLVKSSSLKNGARNSKGLNTQCVIAKPEEVESPKKSSSDQTISEFLNRDYKYGFVSDIESEDIGKGLTEETVRIISAKKKEPEWMLEFRLNAFRRWLQMVEPKWSDCNMDKIDYQDIIYYSEPKQKKQYNSMEEVDPELRATFDKLGISMSEQKRLANVAVDVVFDSVSIATTFKEELAKEKEKKKKLEAQGAAAPPIGSLVPATLAAMETDVEFQRVAQELRDKGQAALTREERLSRQRTLDHLSIPNFVPFLADKGLPAPVRTELTTLQVNVGLYCNQACAHCHVESSPLRTEKMNDNVARRLVALLECSPEVETVDITGGAPELNPQFRFLVKEARRLGKKVIDRCNLTVLYEDGQEDLADFLAEHQVTIVASLPCYSAANVERQRGRGVFDRSISALKDLNARGYGHIGSGLQLDLVYNPVGATLPPPQTSLHQAYKKELQENFGIVFNNLFTITNMPIKRFADFLVRSGQLEQYMQLLVSSFNPQAVGNVMCTNLISVRWDGRLFDCDFNQQLGLGVPRGTPASVFDVDSSLAELVGQRISCDSHCFGCTAGQGSSCTGVVA